MKKLFGFILLLAIGGGIYYFYFYEKKDIYYGNYETVCEDDFDHLMCTVMKNYDAKKNCEEEKCSVLKVLDDHGDSYINYGKVDDNYLVFANYLWKIIRLNGNNSLRLIYAGVYNEEGTYTAEDSVIGYSPYNLAFDNTSIGYMYGRGDDLVKSFTIYNKNFKTNNKIAISKTYAMDNNLFSLVESEEVTLAEMYDNRVQYIGKYFMSEDTHMVNQISDIVYENDIYTIKYYIITIGATNPSMAWQNDNDSEIKQYLDRWYQENLLEYEQYLSDALFCNDRSINEKASDKYSNRAYALETTLYYKDEYIDLKCSNLNDAYTVEDKVYGNHVLTYKIGLLNVQEALFSGIGETKNHYLTSGITYFTMTPFEYRNLTGKMITISDKGKVINQASKTSLGIRPVINLKLTSKLTGGDGTIKNPYKIEMQ